MIHTLFLSRYVWYQNFKNTAPEQSFWFKNTVMVCTILKMVHVNACTYSCTLPDSVKIFWRWEVLNHVLKELFC